MSLRRPRLRTCHLVARYAAFTGAGVTLILAGFTLAAWGTGSPMLTLPLAMLLIQAPPVAALWVCLHVVEQLHLRHPSVQREFRGDL